MSTIGTLDEHADEVRTLMHEAANIADEVRTICGHIDETGCVPDTGVDTVIRLSARQAAVGEKLAAIRKTELVG